MSRSRLVFGFIVMLSMAGLSTTPAFAEFSSEKLSGAAQAVSSVFEGGGGTVECKEAAGEWKLAAKTAATEKLLIKKWTGCTASSSMFKGLEATVSECELELGSASKGVTKEAEILGTVLSKQCLATAKIIGITCEIKIGSEGNKGLKKGKGSNEGASLAVIAEFTGITDTLGGTCPGITATKEAKEKAKILLEGETLGGSGATETSLTTSLSGESKSGETITVLEGAGIKDKATLSGTNAAKATGTVKYAVYSDNACKELVTKAGEVSVTAGSVPESSEEKLTAGASYYWQATYSGDANNLGSTSVCGKEISNVKAATSLKTTLSNGVQKGEKVESNEELPVSDTATLSGTNASTATGTVTYSTYSDKECKTLVTKAGEVTVASGVAPSSIAETLPAGTYYWQAVYSGDSLHQGSTSTCGTEISIFKASSQIKTSLSGEGQSSTRVEVVEGSAVSDSATLSGPNTSKATGTLKYAVYSDEECKTLSAKAGEVTVTKGSVPASSQEKLKAGTYYWQATYSGDANNEGSTAACGEEISLVATATSLSTSLSGGGHSGTTISVGEGTAITDQATLSGVSASKATGDVGYAVYSDKECKTLVAEAGVVSVTAGSIPVSSEEKLTPGTYYWQASYSGDGVNHKSVSSCGSEVSVVLAATTLKTTLSSGEQSHEEISVLEGSGVKDQATLSGINATKATGTLKYAVYSDKECKTLVAKAGEVTVTKGSVPASSEEKLKAGTYYWQATYSGDANNESSTTACGEEIAFVRATLLATSLSGEGHTGEHIQIVDGAIHDTAKLSGINATKATGTLKYAVYSDKECKTLVAKAGEVTVTKGSVPASSEETEPAGTYYWQATYSGDANNEASTAPCGEETAIVGPTPPEVEQVNFTNNMPVILDDQHGLAPESEEAIEESVGHNNAEWEYSPSSKELVKSWPLAYVQATTPELKARFELPTATKQLILEKRLEGKPTITGQTTLEGESITFTKEFASVEELETQVKKHESYIEIEGSSESPIKANKPLPERVGYEAMTIKWTWAIKIKGEASTVTQSLGSSTLNLFTTYAKPPSPACQTVAEAEESMKKVTETEETGACTPIFSTPLVLIATEVNQVRPTERQIIAAAWRVFGKTGNEFELPPGDAGRIVMGNENPIAVPLAQSIQYNRRTGNWTAARVGLRYRYYLPIPPGGTAANNVNQLRMGCFTYREMLMMGTGRCGAWAEALVENLQVMGARAEMIHLVVNMTANLQLPCNEDQVYVCIMLVKNWRVTVATPDSGDIEFPYLARSVQDQLGAAGQGNENPPPYFWDHAIVKAGQGLYTALYDPSYGAGPFPTEAEINEIVAMTKPQPTQAAVSLQYQEASMAGFCRPLQVGVTAPFMFTLPSRCYISEGTGRLGLGAVTANDQPRPVWWP